MGLVDRINDRLARSQSRDISLSVDAYAQFFQFGGITYPLLQTTMGSVDRERIVGSAVGAHQGNAATWALTAARIQAFAQIKFQFARFVGNGAQPGPLFGDDSLTILEKPWPGGSTAQLLAKMELDNCLSGNAYIVNARPGRLARLRPDLVTICLGSQLDAPTPADAPDVEVAGYAYFPRSGKPSFFLPEEVAHYAPFPDPNFQFLGMSWITPCIREIQADSLAVEHKARFFENAATPNLAIKFDPSLDIEAVMGFKKLMENEHRGAFNAYKTLYLGGGADPVTIGKDFQQLDFAVTQGHGESRLAAAAGVPSSWVGFSEGLQGSALNAGNFQSARRRFSDGTMYHLWISAAAALETICPPPDRHANLWFDTRVPFMRDDATDIAAILAQNSASISSLIMQGFDPKSVVAAVAQNDITLLKHTGLTSVQLHPSGQGQLPAGQSANGTARRALTGTGARVYKQLEGSFPDNALTWVEQGDWSGPSYVALSAIDFSHRNEWTATAETDRLHHFEDIIQRGESLDPVVLVRVPGSDLYDIADGHHRSLAYRELSRPVWAWTGQIPADLFGVALATHAMQLKDQGGDEGKRQSPATGATVSASNGNGNGKYGLHQDNPRLIGGRG